MGGKVDYLIVNVGIGGGDYGFIISELLVFRFCKSFGKLIFFKG